MAFFYSVVVEDEYIYGFADSVFAQANYSFIAFVRGAEEFHQVSRKFSRFQLKCGEGVSCTSWSAHTVFDRMNGMNLMMSPSRWWLVGRSGVRMARTARGSSMRPDHTVMGVNLCQCGMKEGGKENSWRSTKVRTIG